MLLYKYNTTRQPPPPMFSPSESVIAGMFGAQSFERKGRPTSTKYGTVHLLGFIRLAATSVDKRFIFIFIFIIVIIFIIIFLWPYLFLSGLVTFGIHLTSELPYPKVASEAKVSVQMPWPCSEAPSPKPPFLHHGSTDCMISPSQNPTTIRMIFSAQLRSPGKILGVLLQYCCCRWCSSTPKILAVSEWRRQSNGIHPYRVAHTSSPPPKKELSSGTCWMWRFNWCFHWT
jgi:hypothetical protein